MDCKTLVLLVGSSPLPNYLAAATLKPERVHLLYSEQTAAFKDRLSSAFAASLGLTDVGDVPARSATKAHDVAEACRRALEGADHLNYTGGTKVMAAQARMMFGAAREGAASYVDEPAGVVRLDNGNEIPIDASTLTIALLLALHGLDVPGPRLNAEGDPCAADTDRLAEVLLQEPARASSLHARVPAPDAKVQGTAAIQWIKSSPLDVGDLGLGLRQIPQPGWTNSNIKHWLKFLRGEWLEERVAATILALDPSVELLTGLRAKLDGREFECDVLFLKRYRPFLVSCTIDDRVPVCKAKLFEAALRARQLGGDLARYAVVSFMPAAGVAQVQRDVAAVWDSPARPRVFGIEHLREWAGIARTGPNLDSLRSWIDQ